jgi:argininosuccinate lyase
MVWGSRVEGTLDEGLKDFLSSVGFDHKLDWADIAGSVAHVLMLKETGLVTEEESGKLIDGLRKVWADLSAGASTISAEHEDVHMNIEALLRNEVGEVADKLHTGRSRNDQVALDLRLYVRDHISKTISGLVDLQETLLWLASNNMIVVQGHTHLQPAQPVLMSHMMLSHFERFQRDIDRLVDAFKRVNISPLGAGALAGTGLPIDPSITADLLGFETTFKNSLDAVTDRDFVFESISCLALISIHLSSLSEEMVLYCSKEFGMASLGDGVSTGSSMMPQKKNPDVFELVRGKTGRVVGALMVMATVLKGLPHAYNKDLQEDKEAVFDTFLTVENCLHATSTALKGLTFHPENASITPDSYATDLCEYLVKKEVPFRVAYRTIGKMVLWCEGQNIQLDQLDMDTLKTFHGAFGPDCLPLLTPQGSVDQRSSKGGTGLNSVSKALAKAALTVEDNRRKAEGTKAPTEKAMALLGGEKSFYPTSP